MSCVDLEDFLTPPVGRDTPFFHSSGRSRQSATGASASLNPTCRCSPQIDPAMLSCRVDSEMHISILQLVISDSEMHIFTSP